MTSSKPRARELGLPLDGITCSHNAITDVPGVLVGFTTINRDRDSLEVGAGPVHTGITAILPHGRRGYSIGSDQPSLIQPFDNKDKACHIVVLYYA